ncbi:MAG: hypothetical protein O2782_16570 [bacterium]|nr:hypothetical protein [bacterium]
MRRTTVLALLLAASASAQSIQLRQLHTGATDISAHVGDTLTIEIVAHLGQMHAAGGALNVSLPAQGLAVVDGTAARPFVPGLFMDGLEFANRQVDSQHIYGLPAGVALLTYSVVLGPGGVRYHSGSGALVTFDVICTAPVTGTIHIVDSAAHQSMVVLDDGRSERAFQQATQIHLSVNQPAAKRAPGTWADVKVQTQVQTQ